jgi:hypothetical protein
MILHILIAMVAGWLQRHQQQVTTYLLAENRVLKAHLGDRRLRLIDTERRRLAALAHPISRTHLKAMATLVTPDTLMRWYWQLLTEVRWEPASPTAGSAAGGGRDRATHGPDG